MTNQWCQWQRQSMISDKELWLLCDYVLSSPKCSSLHLLLLAGVMGASLLYLHTDALSQLELTANTVVTYIGSSLVLVEAYATCTYTYIYIYIFSQGCNTRWMVSILRTEFNPQPLHFLSFQLNK